MKKSIKIKTKILFVPVLVLLFLSCVDPPLENVDEQEPNPDLAAPCSSTTGCESPAFCLSGACKIPSQDIQLEIADDPVVDGVLGVQIDLDANLRFERLDLLVDGLPVGTFAGARGTVHINTLSLTDGSHELIACVTALDGRVMASARTFGVQNPSLRVKAFQAPENTYPGAEVEILLDVEGPLSSLAADFSSLVPDFSASDLEVIVDGRVGFLYRVPATAGQREGWHQVPIRLTGLDGRTVWFRAVRMHLENGPPLPLRATGARLMVGSLPSGGQDTDVRISRLRTDRSVVSGGNLELQAELEGDLDGAVLLVGAEGYGGHLEIPVADMQRSQSKDQTSLRTLLSMSDASGPAPDFLNVKAAVRHASQNVSAIRSAPPIHNQRARHGPLRVSLHWEADQDLDLHVIEPGGEEIYWGRPQSANSGVLEVDGMGDCVHDLETRDELVVWESPPEGEYIVKVDFHRNCRDPQAAIEHALPFRVTVHKQGVNEVTRGQFPAKARADAGAQGAGCEVLRFEWNASFVVQGQATYRHLDLEHRPHVEKTSSLAGIPVQVVDGAGSVLSEKAYVNEDGTYQVAFGAPDTGGPVFLRFQAMDEQVEVFGENGEIHAYQDPSGWLPRDESVEHKDIEIPQDHAGAFHIFEVLSFGHHKIDWITMPWRSQGVPELDRTRVEWIPGRGECTYYGSLGHVAGVPDTLDHFNDAVILRMLGEQIQERLSRDRGGAVWPFHQRLDPMHAWTTGFATFLAMYFLDTRRFCEHSRSASKCIDFDDPHGFVLGTDTQGPGGNISAEVVAGILLDLEDPSDEEHDRLSGLAFSLLEFLFSKMTDAFLDQGRRDAPDLCHPGIPTHAFRQARWVCSRTSRGEPATAPNPGCQANRGAARRQLHRPIDDNYTSPLNGA